MLYFKITKERQFVYRLPHPFLSFPNTHTSKDNFFLMFTLLCSIQVLCSHLIPDYLAKSS